MYLLGLRDTDPWAATDSSSTPPPSQASNDLLAAVESAGSSITSLFTPDVEGTVGSVGPADGGAGTVPPAVATPWYKTWPGVIGIGLAAFLGYRWYSSKNKKAATAA